MCKCMFKIFIPERYDRVNPQCIIIYDKNACECKREFAITSGGVGSTSRVNMNNIRT